MPKKKTENELTPEQQFKRFREKAKELGIDEKDKPLDRALEKMIVNRNKNQASKPS